MQTTIHGKTVGYDDRGGRGVPLLLMHAFPFNRSMFQEQVDGLADVARVITFDAPGVGESEPAPLSMDSIADLGAALLDHLELDKAVVGGVSMGGYASFAFVRRHRERLRGLLLANTRAAADTAEGKQVRAETAAKARREGASAIADAMLPKLLGAPSAESHPILVDRVRGIIESAPPETIAQLLEAMAERPDSTPLLPAIDVPTLVVASDLDVLTPASEARDWAPLIPQGRYVEIGGVGHLANMEAPEAFNRAVADWLRDVAAA